ncbi:hypothetical protein KFE25_007361 [Diacronema lutheri]|uniref:CCR4-NOT transcription complex subunit 3 n=2 Tax=Diacronema lutheri TaxID=2081491 RepID=A0A8J5XJD6_DIALT|nr:hypothetical protein KFE25_007361 [Diacronema lutheri]
MGTTRKLQSEIDRTLKKVQEGVELFDEIWNKVYSATNANQKEKYEGDLKKEIKKLQRYRDDIKTWIAKSDIKDKRPLMDARKAIESEMERFKVCEKEFKTKAFSKEGLGQARKEDPKEVERNKTRKWLAAALSTLVDQIDALEAEIEVIAANKGKKSAKGGKTETELESWVEKHRLHERRMEQILRMIDNETLAPEQVNAIQEQLEYYLESNQEPDFNEDEGLYDELGLDDLPDRDDSDDSRSDASDGTRDEERERVADKKAAVKEERVAKTAAKEAAKKTAAKPAELAAPKEAKDTPATSKAAAAAKQPLPLPAAAVVAGAAKAGAAKGAMPAAQPPARPVKAGGPAPPTAAAVVAAGVAPTVAQVARAAAARPPVAPACGSSSTVAAIVAAQRTEPEAKGSKAGAQPGATAAVPQTVRAGADVEGVQPGSRPAGAPAAPPVGNSWGVPLRPAAHPAMPSRDGALQPQLGAQPHGGGGAALQPSPAGAASQLRGGSCADGGGGARSGALASAGGARAQFSPHTSPALTGASHPHDVSSERQWAAADGAAAAAAGGGAGDESGALSALLAGGVSAGAGAAGSSAGCTDVGGWLRSLQQAAATAGGPVGPASAGHVLAQQLPGADEAVAVGVGGSSSLAAGLGAAALCTDAADASAAAGGGAGGAPGGLGGSVRLDDKSARLRALQASMRNIPELHDSERVKTYVPRNPYPTPGSFPQTPSPIFDQPSTFAQLDTDALFFVFYYQQGTYQQYLAAKELKRQSWRYHKKYLTWFQRHEEPKVTTDEYEQGTYIYFDYETGWCQRIKTDFTFEYGHLEDELNV